MFCLKIYSNKTPKYNVGRFYETKYIEISQIEMN